MPGDAERQEHPVVLRFEGMRPEQIARYESHRRRAGGDLGHVDETRSHLNRRLIGDEDWARQALAEIEEMRAENQAKELEGLARRRRHEEIKRRMVEGPKDPWRPSRHGPMREVILTASQAWFEETRDSATLFSETERRDRERRFEERAVAWLKGNFGDDVVHARADRDEAAYHVHAVILPRATATTKGVERRVLQPSVHPLLKDYERAQDSVGEWFAGIGLVRGERRAAAIREAAATGATPPPRRRHVRPAAWRVQQDLALQQRELVAGKKDTELERRERTLAAAEGALQVRRDELAREERGLEQRAEELGRREARTTEREEQATEREAEADAVIAAAEGLAGGLIELDASGGEAILRPTGEGRRAPALVPLDERIHRSPRGRSRAAQAFVLAWARMRRQARDEARAGVAEKVSRIRSACDAIREIAHLIPPQRRLEMDAAARTVISNLVGLEGWLRNDGVERRQAGAQPSGGGRRKKDEQR